MPHHHCDDGSEVSAVCGCNQLPDHARALWGGEYLCPTHCLCLSPACKREGQHLLHQHCSSMSSLIPPLHCKCQGRPSSSRTYWLHFTCAQRQGTTVPQKLAQSPTSGPVDHPVSVFCSSSPFFLLSNTSFNNKEGLMPKVRFILYRPPCEYCPYLIYMWEKGECFFLLYHFIKICNKEFNVMFR